jgi:hypothetical protein
MIPREWRAHHRPGDGEIVGYLAPAADALVTPMSLLGTSLAPAQRAPEAAALLEREGLVMLAQRWWCRLPQPIPVSGLDPADDQPDWEWRAVVIVEASPTGCVIRPEFSAPEERSRTVSLPIPVGGLLVQEAAE